MPWQPASTVRFYDSGIERLTVVVAFDGYMIVVADTLTEDLIKKALRDIEQRGEVLLCTKPEISTDISLHKGSN